MDFSIDFLHYSPGLQVPTEQRFEDLPQQRGVAVLPLDLARATGLERAGVEGGHHQKWYLVKGQWSWFTTQMLEIHEDSEFSILLLLKSHKRRNWAGVTGVRT